MGFPLSFSKSRRAKKPGKGRATRFRALEERALLSAVRVTALDFLTFEGSYSKTGVSDPERFDWHEVGCGRSSGGHTAACWGSQESYRQDMLSMSAEYADGLASETALKNAILTARGTALSSYVTALENADSSAVTLGLVETDGPFTLTETDLAYGAGISQTLGNVSGSILIGAATGGITKWASVCSNASKGTYAVARAINAWDAAGNVASVATSVYDMSQNGLTAGNVLTAAGSVLGLSGNISGAVAKRGCFTAGTQVLVGETTETVAASDGPYSFVVDNTTAALWIVVGVSATASFAVRQLKKRREEKTEQKRGSVAAAVRAAQTDADAGDSLGGSANKNSERTAKRFSALSVVSVCLLLISLAALFFAVNGASRVKAEPEPAKTAVDGQKRYITKNIEDIRIGERTLGTNPQGSVPCENDAVFSQVKHYSYSLCYRKGNGTQCNIKLLRPEDWLDYEDVRLRREADGKVFDESDFQTSETIPLETVDDCDVEVWLELPEMGVVGWAKLIEIDDEVIVQPGLGNVVTGTFEHISDEVVDLQIEGQEKPIGCTANHPFWSVDRQDFVDAGLLKEGERVQLYSGETKRVVQRLPRPGPQNVYNLEVYSEHVYCVEDLGILVHNKCNERYYKPNGKIRRFDGHKPAYEVNEAHVFGPKYVIGKTPLPADAQEVFSKAIPSDPDNPSVWFAKNEAGKIYRYSLNHDKTVAHFSGIYLEGPGTRNITDYARLRLGILKRKGLKCR